MGSQVGFSKVTFKQRLEGDKIHKEIMRMVSANALEQGQKKVRWLVWLEWS